jgi:hypothetical protein
MKYFMIRKARAGAMNDGRTDVYILSVLAMKLIMRGSSQRATAYILLSVNRTFCTFAMSVAENRVLSIRAVAARAPTPAPIAIQMF